MAFDIADHVGRAYEDVTNRELTMTAVFPKGEDVTHRISEIELRKIYEVLSR